MMLPSNTKELKMKTGRTFTLKMLEDAEACPDQIGEFKKRFGNEVKVTESLCESVGSVFYWPYAICKFLSPPAKKQCIEQFIALWDRCKQSIELKNREAFDKHAAVWHAHYHDNLSWNAANYQSSVLWKEYGDQFDAAMAKFKRDQAVLFAKMYNSEA